MRQCGAFTGRRLAFELSRVWRAADSQYDLALVLSSYNGKSSSLHQTIALNIIIVGTGLGFPDGAGAAARVMCYARGLVQNGAVVRVFCTKPSENTSSGLRNPHLEGVIDGVYYEYTSGRRVAAKTRVAALALYLRGLWRACHNARSIHRETPVDAIVLYNSTHPIDLLVFGALAKMLGAVLITDECEFPFVNGSQTIAVRARRWFRGRLMYWLVDGVIVISTFLRDYYVARLRETTMLIHIPILVECELFVPGVRLADRTDRRIVYCGGNGHESEVAELLRAFAQCSADFPEWRVQLIGEISGKEGRSELCALISQHNLTGRVLFTGWRPRKDIPHLLSEGDIMALARAEGLFSTAGFPTKLGEYLASGKPVVTTATGDIPRYLRSGVDAFLVHSGDTVAFAETLRYVMSHPEHATEVGLRGRQIALKEFSNVRHGARLIEFIGALQVAHNT